MRTTTLIRASIFLTVVAGLVSCTVAPAYHPRAEAGTFCASVSRSYPDLTWTDLRPGTTLGAFEAILTCGSSYIEVRSPRPVGGGFAWTESGDGFRAQVAGDVLMAIVPLDGRTGPEDMEVQVVTVSGTAYHSKDRDTIRRHSIFLQDTMSTDEYARLQSAREGSLGGFGWQPMAAGRILGPWDMIWTREGGRVEIEVVDPPGAIIRGWSAVLDEAGRAIGKNRLMSNVQFIMVPTHFRQARINKVIGDVWIATDTHAVKTYFEKYGYVVARFGRFDEEARRRWQELLRRPELE